MSCSLHRYLFSQRRQITEAKQFVSGANHTGSLRVRNDRVIVIDAQDKDILVAETAVSDGLTCQVRLLTHQEICNAVTGLEG